MTAIEPKNPLPKMTCAEFRVWKENVEGRWELHDGVPVRIHDPARGQAERMAHIRAKLEMVMALRSALRDQKLDCEAVSDGATVEVAEERSYEPDALVYCGERLGKDELVVPNPVIIVEVLSPSTARKDVSDKLRDYFRLPSVMHYFILDTRSETVSHYFRRGDEIIFQPLEGETVRLDPPGMDVALTELFA